MYTPVDIQNMTFSKATFGGYNKSQVDEFVQEIATQFETSYKENLELKDRITVLNESLKQYKNMEDALQNTLMFAQNTAEDVKKNAKEKAENLVNEANLKAKEIVSKAQEEKFALEQKISVLKEEYKAFETKFSAMLASQQKILEESFQNAD